MSVKLDALHNQVIAYLKEGKFVEGIEDFYHENVTAQENSNPPTKGRAAMATTERKFQKKGKAFHGIDILATAIDDQGGGTGVVLYECVMKWEQTDKGHVKVEQTVVERWNGGKIAHIRFYGNYEPGPLED